MGSRKHPRSTYLIRNAPSDRVEESRSDELPSERPDPTQRWRSSKPPAPDGVEASWWPDQGLGQAFRRWTSIPPANAGRSIALDFLVEHLKVTGIDARGTAPQVSERPVAPPDSLQRIKMMVERLGTHGPNEEAPEYSALLKLGEDALPALRDAFPGQLWFSRWEPHSKPARGRDISGLCRVFVQFGAMAIPYLVEVLESEDSNTRYYATLVAADLKHPALIKPLATALLDTDPGVARGALQALACHRDEVGYRDCLAVLREVVAGHTHDQRDRLLALRALAVFRDVDVIEALISLLAGRLVLREASWRTLRMLTLQDFGENQEAWRAWYRANRESNRFEWLVEGLDHSDPEIRDIAGHDLVETTQRDFGYHKSLPKDERQEVMRQYRAWRFASA